MAFKLEFKDGNTTYYGSTVQEIARKVFVARQKSNHPMQNYNVIYNQVLRKGEESSGAAGKPPKKLERPSQVPRVRRKVTAREAFAASKALIKIAAGKGVHQDEIDRRSSICRGCPQLSKTSDCGSCAGARKRLAHLAGSVSALFKTGVTLPSFNGKPAVGNFCGVCGCSMALLIQTKVEDYTAESDAQNISRPPRCWLRKDSPNYQASE